MGVVGAVGAEGAVGAADAGVGVGATAEAAAGGNEIVFECIGFCHNFASE